MSSAVLAVGEAKRGDSPRPEKLVDAGPLARGDTHWLAELRGAAWDSFESSPMPVRKDEAWRFANLKSINLESFSPPVPVDLQSREELLSRSQTLLRASGRLVFANDELISCETFGDELQAKGLIWLPLEQAAVEHAELFRKYFMREETILGGRKFAALHRSQVRAGTFLYIPPHVKVKLPIEAFHWLHGDGGSCFPHTLIVADEMSSVTLVDHFQSADPTSTGLACGVNDLWLGDGAKVKYVCTQRWSNGAVALQMNSTVVGREAHAIALNLNLGASYGRTESVSRLRGPGGRSDMLAVSAATGAQELDQRTLQIHEVPNTSSDPLYKNSLEGVSRTIFAGLIRVNPGAHKTDAYQKVRNLLLSDEAEANSAPGLEIEADDVRCTHGATSGQINAEELFYLRSRGIPPKEAQRLIVRGFLREVIERLGDEAIETALVEMMQAKLEGSSR